MQVIAPFTTEPALVRGAAQVRGLHTNSHPFDTEILPKRLLASHKVSLHRSELYAHTKLFLVVNVSYCLHCLTSRIRSMLRSTAG